MNDHATFIGDKDVVDYNNLLSKENNIEDFLDLLNKIFQTKISKLSLYSISEDSHFFSNFKNSKLENLYKVNIQEEDVSPYLLLPETWDEYLMNLSKKRRHEIKRKIRRFEENFDFSSGDHNSIDNFEEIFDDFIRLHKLSSDEKNLFMNITMSNYVFIFFICNILLMISSILLVSTGLLYEDKSCLPNT